MIEISNTEILNLTNLTPDIKARIVGPELLKEKSVYTEETSCHGGTVGWSLEYLNIYHSEQNVLPRSDPAACLHVLEQDAM